jgi:peroxiredoxin
MFIQRGPFSFLCGDPQPFSPDSKMVDPTVLTRSLQVETHWRVSMCANTKVTIFTVYLLTFFFFNFGCQKQAGAGPTAPDFTLADTCGHKISLNQYRGRIVVLDFWATWCGPCVAAIPELVKLQEKHRDQGLVIFGITMDDPQMVTDEDLRAFKKKAKINYTILRFNNKVVQDYLGEPPAIPAVFLIDREMKIIDKIVGYRPGALEKSLMQVLK